MLSKVKNYGMKKWISALIALLFITDVAILLDIPFLREVAAFIYFTTVPGILILHILKLNRMEFPKKVVLSIGLSISFIIFSGLLLNSLYPVLLKPLSLAPVLILFNVLLIIMAVVAYHRNKENFFLKEFLNLKIKLEGNLTSMLIFPVLFPFMAILGTYLMNTTENNFMLLLMLILIPIYIVAVVLFRNRISKDVYPFSIVMISLSLLLMHGLTSFHVMGRDVQWEFYCFNLALDGFHWDILEYYNPYNVCLSITILPVIYKTLTNFNSEFIFKLFFALIGSIIPLVIYIVSKKYVGKQGAFFASLLFAFQTYFIYILGMVRQEIAFLFLFLAVLVFFDDNINKLSKKILFVLLILSVIVSHYATSYITLILIIPILFLPFLKSLINYIKSIKSKEKSKLSFENFDIIAIISAFIAFWYLTAAKVQAEASNFVAGSTIAATQGVSTTIAKDPSVTSIFGIGLKSFPNTISVFINDLIFITIAIGLFYLLWNNLRSKNQLSRFEKGYVVGVLMSVLLLISFVLLPFLSIAYGAQRLFLQLLIFLSPVFVIGGYKLSKIIKKPKIAPWIIVILLISLFTCGTYLQYHFAGMPYSPYYEKDSSLRDEHFIYDQEILATSWLKNNGINEMGIQTDGIAYSRLILGYGTELPNYKKTRDFYIYLGYANVNKKLLYTNLDYPDKITDYDLFLKGKNKIYDNGGSEILISIN